MYAATAARPLAAAPHLALVAETPSVDAGLAALLEALPSGAAVIGADDRVLAMNERFSEMDAVVSVTGRRLVAVGAENATELRRLFLEARASASVGGRAIAKAAFRDGEDRPVFATARPYAAGGQRAVLVMVDDLARPSRADLAAALRLSASPAANRASPPTSARASPRARRRRPSAAPSRASGAC